jgi:hypothetical protein
MCIAGHTGDPPSYVGKEYEFTLDTLGSRPVETVEAEGYGSW